MDSAATFWNGLEAPWRRTLELAWESFTEGSVPVGSVLTDDAGEPVAEARNRSRDEGRPSSGLAGSYIAHAEINALSTLPPGEYAGHVLWSSLQPCFMCSAAVLHSHVGGVRFAASDPLVAGVERLPELNPWAASRWPDRRGPASPPLADVAGLLHAVFFLELRPDGPAADVYHGEQPDLSALARRYIADRTLHELDGTVLDALEVVWPDLV